MAFVPREYLRFPRLVPGRLGRYTQVCRLACWLKSVRRWPAKEEVTTERNQCLYRATGGFPQFQHQQRGNHLARSPPHRQQHRVQERLYDRGTLVRVSDITRDITRKYSMHHRRKQAHHTHRKGAQEKGAPPRDASTESRLQAPLGSRTEK